VAVGGAESAAEPQDSIWPMAASVVTDARLGVMLCMRVGSGGQYFEKQKIWTASSGYCYC
jgi:hypothetical protein